MGGHGMAQLCQHSRMQLSRQGRQQQTLLPCDLVKAVQGVEGQVIGVRAGLFAASSQAMDQDLDCCMPCNTSKLVSSQIKWAFLYTSVQHAGLAHMYIYIYIYICANRHTLIFDFIYK